MTDIENILINNLIEKDENYTLSNALNDSYKEFINQNKTNELQDFMNFCDKLVSISKSQIENIDTDSIGISKEEAIRITMAKNLYDCLSNDSHTFLEYLDEKENEMEKDEQVELV